MGYLHNSKYFTAELKVNYPEAFEQEEKKQTMGIQVYLSANTSLS